MMDSLRSWTQQAGPIAFNVAWLLQDCVGSKDGLCGDGELMFVDEGEEDARDLDIMFLDELNQPYNLGLSNLSIVFENEIDTVSINQSSYDAIRDAIMPHYKTMLSLLLSQCRLR